MKLQNLVAVALRLMALNFLLKAVVMTPQFLHGLPWLRSAAPSDPMWMFVFPWFDVIARIAAGILLWVFALPIVRLISRGVSQEISCGSVSLADCYAVAFIPVGLFYFASHLPQVLNWLHYFITSAASRPGGDWRTALSWYDVSNAFIPFVVGVVFFVKGRLWALALARKDESH